MRSRLRVFLVLLVGLVAWIPELAAQTIGSVSRTQGDVRTAGAGARILTSGSGIELGDVLTTGPGGRVEVVLLDSTVLTLGEHARLVIDEFVFDAGQGTGRASLNFVQGAFRVVTGLIARQPDRPLAIRTAVATIGIRGTDFWGGPLDNPLNVLVLDGAVLVSTNAGQVVLLPGQGTNIEGPNLAPEAATIWGQDRVTRAIATITFQ